MCHSSKNDHRKYNIWLNLGEHLFGYAPYFITKKIILPDVISCKMYPGFRNCCIEQGKKIMNDHMFLLILLLPNK